MTQPTSVASAGRSHRRALLVVCTLAGTAAAATPAAAQFYGYYGGYSYNVPPPYPGPYGGPRPYGYGYGPDPYARPAPQPLPPRLVIERLEQQGYEDVSRPRFTGTLYIVEATTPGDIRMRVVVDAIRGVILNRTALGERRAFGLRDDLDDERRDARPPRPAAPERRREVSRTPVQPAPGALVAPADPRLAPGGSGGAAAPLEPSRPPSPRSATRTPQAAPKPAAAPEVSPAPYGVNPETSPRRKAVDPKSPVDAKTPAGTPPARPTTEAESRSGKAVRVIEGVTPSNSGGASTPLPLPPAANPLDTLPQPPAAEAPTGLN